MIMRPPPSDSPAILPFVPRHAALSPPPFSASEAHPQPQEPGDPRASWTLLEAYEHLLEPQKMATTGAKQRSRHKKSAREFESYVNLNHRSSTPMVRLLSSEPQVLTEFAEWLVNRGASPVTVGHRLTDVMMICHALRDAGLLDKMPSRPAPKELKAMKRQGSRPQRKVSKAVCSEDIGKLLKACDAAKYPEFPGVTPGEWWRAMICWHALYGPRTQDIYAYAEKRKTGLTWDDVFFAPQCPDVDLQQALPDLSSPHGWLYYPISKDVKSDCPFVLFPMPLWLSRFIHRFRGLTDPAGQKRVFPVSRSHKKFGEAWSEIRRAGGVGDHVYLSQGTGGAAALRKNASRWWKRITRSDEVAQYMLHHAEVTVAAQHYLDTMEIVVPQLLTHLAEFPYSPDEF